MALSAADSVFYEDFYCYNIILDTKIQISLLNASNYRYNNLLVCLNNLKISLLILKYKALLHND